MANAVYAVSALQMVKQSAFGTGITTATYLYPGEATLEIGDVIVKPRYLSGVPGQRTAENAYPTITGTIIKLKDTAVSPTLMVWLMNMAIKGVAGPLTSFPFTTPTTNAANTPNVFSFKVVTSADVWDVADCFITDFNFHGDADENNGQVLINATIVGRKATPSGTMTAALTQLPNHIAGILNQNNATIKVAALGSAPSGGTQQTGTLGGLSLDWKTGFYPGRYSDGRAALDYAQIDGGGLDYDIKGVMSLLLGSNAVTHIANARAGTGKNIQLLYTAGNTDSITIALPIVFDKVGELLNKVRNGMVFVEMPFTVDASTTATALYPSITCAVSSTTVT